MIKYFCITGMLFTEFIYATNRPDAFACNQRKKSDYCYARRLKMVTKKGRPYGIGRPGGYGWHNGPLSGGPLPQDGNGTNNNHFDSLAAMAPIAMAMYCFNSAPKLTMITLTTLLLFIAGSDNE